MGELLNLEEVAVFLSLCGIVCWLGSLKVRRSQPWQESSAWKRSLLAGAGLLLQVPVALVVVFEPVYVTGWYSVEDFDFRRLLLNYVVQGSIFAGVGLLARWLE